MKLMSDHMYLTMYTVELNSSNIIEPDQYPETYSTKYLSLDCLMKFCYILAYKKDTFTYLQSKTNEHNAKVI